MLSNKFKEIQQYKAKLVEMEKAVLAERETQLKRLHLDMGFASQVELIKALRTAGSAPATKPGRKRKPAAAPAKKASRKRAKITPELRQKIVEAIVAGGKGGAVARKFGVSVPTVQNIKKAAGLVKKGKGGASAAPAASAT
jgi:DNA invertase Pin-like site-specific DNA recombinase